MSDLYEMQLELSADLVRNCCGLSMDMGGSLLKVVYRSKEEWKSLCQFKDAETGKLNLISFNRDQIDKALRIIKENCHLSDNGDDDTKITITGVGCHENQAKIAEQLNVKSTLSMELNCFVKSFVYLSKRMSRMTFLYSLNPKDVRKVDGYIRLIDYEAQMTSAGLSNLQNPPLEYLKQVSVDHHLEYSGLESDPLDVTMEDMYPCMVAMCGSGNAFLKVYADGKFEVMSFTNVGGRMLLGLGSLLSGYKTFKDMIGGAERGDNSKVDITMKDFTAVGEDDMYSVAIDMSTKQDFDQLLFHFGKTVGKSIDEFDADDLCQSTVFHSTKQTVWSIYNTAAISGVKHVFMTGSYFNHPFIREKITEWWLIKTIQHHAYDEKMSEIRHHFVRPGAYMGALGALFMQMEAN